MISHINGKILYKEEKYLIVETGGIGYKIFTTSLVIQKMKMDSPVSLWTHFVVKEDSQDLYGFDTKDELDFFELLIGISGIGPKSALNILNLASLESLKKAVSSGDTSHLIKVSGVSKKNAEKIVLELKGKFGNETELTLRDEVDALEALKSLGYSHKDAREALKENGNGGTTEERVKAALKILGK